MDESDYFLLEFGLVLLFLFFLTFFAFFESALHRLTRFDLKLLNEQHRHKKYEVLHLLSHNNLKVIIPLNFGIQLSFIILAIFTTHIVLIQIKFFPILWAFLILFIINILFCQLVPRIVTHVHPDKKLLFLLPLFSLLFPVLRFLAYPINLVVQKVEDSKIIPVEKKSKEVVKKEIQALIDIGKEEDVLEKDEGELVRSVLEFGDAKAREVMTPRSKIIAVQENATLKEVKDLMVKEKHSRIPVYQENLDQITGVIYVRHLLKKFKKERGDESINDLLLPPVFVSEKKSLSELLKEIKTRRTSMVFVKNDYGGIAGLITIEDILEEIVGEISDEDQTEEEEIIPQGKNLFLVSGNVSLDKLSDTLEVRLEDDDCQTIGGLITKIMGRLPKRNEQIEISGISIKVLNVDSRKVNRLLLERFSDLSAETPSPEPKDV
ncbi:MAG: HlyC/CorC family transporter [Deltaproteobacteria bacterium]|nr:HlyC/CorC family transporter [Deltaproteobacteria bacterium]